MCRGRANIRPHLVICVLLGVQACPAFNVQEEQPDGAILQSASSSSQVAPSASSSGNASSAAATASGAASELSSGNRASSGQESSAASSASQGSSSRTTSSGMQGSSQAVVSGRSSSAAVPTSSSAHAGSTSASPSSSGAASSAAGASATSGGVPPSSQPGCSDGCSADVCDGADGYRVCGQYDADACRELSPRTACPAPAHGTAACTNGHCEVVCQAGYSACGTSCCGAATAAAQISAGLYHTCVLTTAGGVKCWGENSWGQLGAGDNLGHGLPTEVTGLATGIAAVSAGYAHTCALTVAGTVKCWGFNADGRLGDGSQLDSNVPVDVSGLAGVRAIAAGGQHTCALTLAGTVSCWGFNGNGQLGDGSTVDSTTPVDASGLSGAVAVATGSHHSCAVVGDRLRCWGLTPADVYGLTSGVRDIAMGYRHSCARMTGGAIQCLGYNWYGQLGDASNTDASSPVNPVGMTGGMAAVATGYNHTCALTATGGVKCWGYNCWLS